MKFEILAPAGTWESLVAGVRCGADAVYLGCKALNARRSAGNFNDDELKNAAAYCRARGVKLYLTLNTLCGDGELPEAYGIVENALSYGVDAFIVQDFGLAEMIKNCFPQARLHASTQMSVMSPQGVKALEDMGFSRAVLARELSAAEIAEIRENCGIELEMFVHGAHCMSVSGQCYMSSVIGARSGNRGLCAQPCRLPFSAGDGHGYALSLKDLSLIGKLAEIEKTGVVSLKIEGRMKRPEYVAAAVTALKKAVRGEYRADDEETLKSVFSRSGFTSGYFDGRLGKNMFGVRRKEDVTAAAPVLKDLSRLYEKENPLVPIDMEFECGRGKPMLLKARALGKNVEVTGSVPETARTKALTRTEAEERLSKLGATQFYPGKITVEIDDGLNVSASALNALRREAVEKLTAAEKFSVNALPMPRILPRAVGAEPYFTARFSDARRIPAHHPFARVFIPIWSDDGAFGDLHAGVEIPRGLFGKEKEITERLIELKKSGVNKALCGNIGSYRLAKALGFEAFGDFGLNVFNSIAARKFNSPILSFELSLGQANAVNAEDTGIIGYGRLPLMLARNCPVKNDIGCVKCGRKGALTDRTGARFPVVCSPYPCAEVLNSVPLYMGDRLRDIKTDFIHFYFTDESAEDVLRIISLYKAGAKADFPFTRGLYYRGVK